MGRELPKVRGGGVGDRTHTTGHVCGGQRGRVSVRGCVCVVRVLPNYLFMKKSHVWLCVGEEEKRGKGGKKKRKKTLIETKGRGKERGHPPV